MARDDDLVGWMNREYRIAAREMLRSVSATGLRHARPAFGQTMRPAKGSVLASPVSAHYDPEPDYFFHWLRDSAVVMDAVSILVGDGTLGAEGHAIIADHVAFSLGLDALDGRLLGADPGYGADVAPEARQYLRSREEMTAVHGDRVRMEARYNPDGSLDIIRWGRPQFDGPATRALALMRHARTYGTFPELDTLVDADIDFTLRHAGAEGHDIWEERLCADYYTRSVQQRLLAEAAVVAPDDERGNELEAAALHLEASLDGHWSAERNAYRSAAGDGGASDRDIDFAVVLAALHAGRDGGRHSVCDPRMQATFATLADVFAGDYAINRARPGAAPAMGRYRGDVYQSGGAFYFSTLGAAEFHYRLAGAAVSKGIARTRENARFLAQAEIGESLVEEKAIAFALLKRGDGFMDIVRQFTPSSGALSEQFDQTDGRQTSAQHLAWSYAAFITATAARRRAVALLGRSQRS